MPPVGALWSDLRPQDAPASKDMAPQATPFTGGYWRQEQVNGLAPPVASPQSPFPNLFRGPHIEIEDTQAQEADQQLSTSRLP